VAVLAFYCFVAFSLMLLKWVNPPTTAVQAERRISAIIGNREYHKRYHFVPLSLISPQLQHAIIAAEDARFFQHHGYDWGAMRDAAEKDIEEGRHVGASTITQQLVRNLYLSTSRSLIRKGVEFTIVPFAEAILGKRRILELYLNVVEFGPAIYGVESGCEVYFHLPAERVSRTQAIALAEVLPAPLHRKPGQTPRYGLRIAARMHELAW
jgi:monofunctional biosynthetic peptidoglycan transglycosylase